MPHLRQSSSPLRGPRSDAEKVLETIAGMRCPCGHLGDRRRQPEGRWPGEKLGACRDCECKGLIDWTEEEEADG